MPPTPACNFGFRISDFGFPPTQPEAGIWIRIRCSEVRSIPNRAILPTMYRVVATLDDLMDPMRS